MESRSLNTASTYINNLLLSRGLLRDGAPIDFATPEKAKGGTDATMVRVMNLVHDLILRRDVRSHESGGKQYFHSDMIGSVTSILSEIYPKLSRLCAHPRHNKTNP